MSGNSLKDLLRDDGPAKRFAEELQPQEEAEAYQAFNYGRVGLRPQLMVCFVKCDGHHLALPYAELRSITTSDPDKGFLLEFIGREVLIEGLALTICFRYLRTHRLAELIEIDRPGVMAQPDETPVVHKIVIRRPRPVPD